MHILGMNYNIADVTEELAEHWNETMKNELESAKVSTDIIKVPEAFKKDTKWHPFKESVTTFAFENRSSLTSPGLHNS